MIENMTRKDFMKLFGIEENSDAMDCFDETVNSSGMSWYDLAKTQINTINFINRYNELNSVKEDK